MKPTPHGKLCGALLASALLVPSLAHAHEGGGVHEHDDQTPMPAAQAPAPAAPQPADAQPAADAPQPETARAVVVPAPSRQMREGSVDGRHRNIPTSDWRQRSRSGAGAARWLEAGHFAAEIRFAPYFWQVQDSGGLVAPDGLQDPNYSGDPFSYFFGDPTSFYFGLELDWLPIHIPYVGSLGVGFGWGWTTVSGSARTATGEKVEAETSVTVFPMHGSGVLRVDGPLRRFGIPVVPHIKVGFGVAPWSTSTDGNDNSPSSASAGLHLGLGGSLALNAFDQSAARAMYQDTGIRYTYLWAEWMYDDLGGIGNADQLRVGTSTVALGLALDW